MRICAAIAAAALAAGGCAAPVAPVAAPAAAVAARGPVSLRNPGFELDAIPGARCASGWSCTMHSDPNSFRFFTDESGAAEGKRAFCIEPVTKEPWALLTQATFDKSLRGAHVRFSIAMRLTGVAGNGAGPWAQVQSPSARPRTYTSLVANGEGWQTRSVEFDVPGDALSVEVGAMLRGTGRACFDDARLEILQPGGNAV